MQGGAGDADRGARADGEAGAEIDVVVPGAPGEVWFDALHALINTTEFRFRR